MNLRDLKYFIALAEHEHFGKAADACFVSQPTLSMQIKKLEQELEAQLIERNNKNVRITATGQRVLHHARQIIATAEQLKHSAKVKHNPFNDKLILGAFPTLAPYLLPILVPKLHQHHPELELYLVEHQTQTLIDQLQNNTLDAALLALPINDDKLICRELFCETFYLAVSETHPLSKRKRIKQRELKDISLMLLEEGHCLRDNALAVCQFNQAKAPHNFRASSLETLRQMVASGNGTTLMPKLAMKDNDHIHYIDFSNPKPSRRIGLVWRKDAKKSAMLETLANTLTQWLKYL